MKAGPNAIGMNGRCETRNGRSRCTINALCFVPLGVLFIYAVTTTSEVLAQDVITPAVKDRIADVFVPADYAETSYTGYLADRMQVNFDKRLLALDLNKLLSGYEHRPGVQVFCGEHIGKFLDAAVYAWRFTGNDALKQRMDEAVRRLIATQLQDGYLGTYLDDDRWKEWDVWSHKYNLIGLGSYYQATGYQPALDACKEMADLLCDTFGKDKRDIIDSGFHKGMASTSVLEPMARLYRLTGDKRYLAFCRYIIHAWEQPNGPKTLSTLLDSGNVSEVGNGKGYEMLSTLVGLMEMYRLEGDERYLQACKNAWSDIVEHHLYPIGTTNVYHGHFLGECELPKDGGPDAATSEGCDTVTWLQLNMHLLQVTGDPKYAAQLERTVYNALLGAQSPHTGMVCMWIMENGKRHYGDVSDNFVPDIFCCSSSLQRGVAWIPEFVSGAVNGDPTLFQYVAGTHLIHAQAGNKAIPIQLTVDTDYPKSGTITIQVDPPEAMRFPLLLRVPEWADAFVARVGEETYAGRAGEMLSITREWTPGDAVAATVDTTLRVIPNPDKDSNGLLFARGPQVLAQDDVVSDYGRLPPSAIWWGDQLYTDTGIRDDENKPLILVPFAEAGQNREWYRAVFDNVQLDPSLNVKRLTPDTERPE